MNDYERIARVIRYLDEHHAEQPDLAALAKCAGLSPFHFHRLFSTWAGVTPKDFLQCLTLAHLKQSLQNGQSVLDSALDAGLSGPGRAHDLCVDLEAATPGEMKTGGDGWTLVAGFAETPFGTSLIAESPRGICHLAFIEPGNEDTAWAGLHENWPNARLRRNDSAAARIAAQIFKACFENRLGRDCERGEVDGEARRGRIFDRKSVTEEQRSQTPRPAARPPDIFSKHALTHPTRRTRPALRAFVRGTPFQLRVWRALIQVPSGHLTTYGRLAAMLDTPTAARAVGSAVGANSVAYLIPCHRVIRETGVVGGYRWGPLRKRALLTWEEASTAVRRP